MADRHELSAHWARRARDRRAELGLTQEEVAEASGVSQQAVSRLENGAGGSADARRAVARALQVSPSDLFPAYPEDLVVTVG